MKTIKIGIMGMGRGESFMCGYANMEGVEVVGICNEDLQRLEDIKANIPEGTLVFTDFNEFIKCEMDALVLANEFHKHACYAITAMKKGIHILSETTAAPTLGECVELCEAAEESGAKYMLATNQPYRFGCVELVKLYKEGTFGDVLYAEGEYFHPSTPGANTYSPGEHHWRKHLPRTYYNMHDLGTLMLITGLEPKKVSAKAIFVPEFMKKHYPQKYTGDVGSVVLTEMDSGAVFRTTACASLPPASKWFRLACENGTLETERGDEMRIYYNYNPWLVPEGKKATDRYDAPRYEMSEEQLKSGHGGTDYNLHEAFIRYLRDEEEPFFDVYRSVALSAVGILAWRSVLDGGREFDIPDFRDKEARRAFANDYLTPFPDADGNGSTLPCSSRPYQREKQNG